MIVRTSVLFPAPLGPRRPRTSPSRTSSETPSSALRPLKDLATLETTSGAATAARLYGLGPTLFAFGVRRLAAALKALASQRTPKAHSSCGLREPRNHVRARLDVLLDADQIVLLRIFEQVAERVVAVILLVEGRLL